MAFIHAEMKDTLLLEEIVVAYLNDKNTATSLVLYFFVYFYGV